MLLREASFKCFVRTPVCTCAPLQLRRAWMRFMEFWCNVQNHRPYRGLHSVMFPYLLQQVKNVFESTYISIFFFFTVFLISWVFIQSVRTFALQCIPPVWSLLNYCSWLQVFATISVGENKYIRCHFWLHNSLYLLAQQNSHSVFIAYCFSNRVYFSSCPRLVPKCSYWYLALGLETMFVTAWLCINQSHFKHS